MGRVEGMVESGLRVGVPKSGRVVGIFRPPESGMGSSTGILVGMTGSVDGADIGGAEGSVIAAGGGGIGTFLGSSLQPATKTRPKVNADIITRFNMIAPVCKIGRFRMAVRSAAAWLEVEM